MLESRPVRNALVRQNIVRKNSVAPALQGAASKLERALLRDQLSAKLRERSELWELTEAGL